MPNFQGGLSASADWMQKGEGEGGEERKCDLEPVGNVLDFGPKETVWIKLVPTPASKARVLAQVRSIHTVLQLASERQRQRGRRAFSRDDGHQPLRGVAVKAAHGDVFHVAECQPRPQHLEQDT